MILSKNVDLENFKMFDTLISEEVKINLIQYNVDGTDNKGQSSISRHWDLLIFTVRQTGLIDD